MTASRYSRLNPPVTTQNLAGDDPKMPQNPLQFSNSIPDATSNLSPNQFSSSSQGSLEKNPYFREQIPSPDTTYQGFIGQPEPKRPKRQRTGSSIISSVWTSTKNFAVSNFTVPKVGAPWEHEITEKDGVFGGAQSDTVRFFNHRRQRQRLFVNTSFQFFLTAFFAAALVSALYGFSTMIYGMSTIRKRVFNALVTGLSLCLGLNVASSFVGYAQMMRWRFLASGYRTLQDFELVMNCDSLSKTFRLIWVGRNRGSIIPSKTQLLALFWILLNLATQIFIALIGLTYSIDISNEWVQTQYGNVSVAQLDFISNTEFNEQFDGDFNSFATYLSQSAIANIYGITGQDYIVVETNIFDYSGGSFQIYTDTAHDTYWYRFLDNSPNVNNPLSQVSDRSVNATARCESFPVVQGGFAGFDSNDTDTMWYTTWVDAAGQNRTWWIPNVAADCTTWMTNMTADCGPRCAQIYALQSASSDGDVPEPRFWTCYNEVSEVANAELYENSAYYVVPDLQASIMAGAIGTNGLYTADSEGNAEDLQVVLYAADTQWSPPGDVTPHEMEELVAKFTAGAFGALDQNGYRYNVSGYFPVPAQIVNVQWKYAGAILAGIPFFQFCIWVLVIAFANKAIIKDTSHLSTARLLRPIVEKLGDGGCLLTGDEIAEKLGNFKVIYGVRHPSDPTATSNGASGGLYGMNGVDDGAIKHLDVIEQTEGLGYRRGRMQEGRYDGLHPSMRVSTDIDERTSLLADYEVQSAIDQPEALRRLNGLEARPRRARRMSM